MTDTPLVSILMANHDGARYLGASIASVLAQSVDALELIVSDDGSTDESLAVAQEAATRDDRVRVIAAPSPGGPGAARNRALDAARGTWVAIVDSDDLIHPERLGRLIARAGALGVDAVADDLVLFGSERGRTLLGPARLKEPWVLDATAFVAAETTRPPVPVGYLKPVIRRAALGDLRYREEMRVGEDFDFLLRAILRGVRFAVVPEGWYLYRRHRASISHRLGMAEAMAIADAAKDLMGDVDGKSRVLLGERVETYRRAARFAALVRGLKERRPDALAVLAKDPALALPLARAASENLTRRLVRPASDGDGASLRLLAESDPTKVEGAVRIPDASGGWTAARAAQVSALAGDGSARIEARGRAGLEALGYVPGWDKAVLVAPEGGWSETERRRIAALPWPVELA